MKRDSGIRIKRPYAKMRLQKVTLRQVYVADKKLRRDEKTSVHDIPQATE